METILTINKTKYKNILYTPQPPPSLPLPLYKHTPLGDTGIHTTQEVQKICF